MDKDVTDAHLNLGGLETFEILHVFADLIDEGTPIRLLSSDVLRQAATEIESCHAQLEIRANATTFEDVLAYALWHSFNACGPMCDDDCARNYAIRTLNKWRELKNATSSQPF